MEQVLQGNVGQFTLPEIFQLVASGRKTGTLGIQKDDSIVMIYFEKGQIIYGYGPRKTYHLGQLLKERGKISSEQLDDAVSTQEKSASSKRLGQILMEKKFINRADLEKVVRKQVEELIYSLLSWDSGTFKFYENQYPTQEEITVNISVENAILEGYRRIDELNRARGALPDFEQVLTIAPAPAERKTDISFQSEEWNLLALVSGRRTINEIVDISNLPKTETLQKLAALKLAGLITEAGKKGEEEADRLTVMVDRVSRLFEEYLQNRTKRRTDEITTIQNLNSATNSRLTDAHLSISKTGEDN
jgi:hypothetical protein